MSTRPLPTSRWLRRIVQPFERDQTARWKERQKILTLLENIKQRADEAEKCLTIDEYGQKKPEQATRALEELEELWIELRRFAPDLQRLNVVAQTPESHGHYLNHMDTKSKPKPIEGHTAQAVALPPSCSAFEPSIEQALRNDGMIRVFDGRWSGGFVNESALREAIDNGFLAVKQRHGMSFAMKPNDQGEAQPPTK